MGRQTSDRELEGRFDPIHAGVRPDRVEKELPHLCGMPCAASKGVLADLPSVGLEDLIQGMEAMSSLLGGERQAAVKCTVEQRINENGNGLALALPQARE